MTINDPRYRECPNPAEARWPKYICNYENNVSSRLSAHDVRLHIAGTNEPRVLKKQSKERKT